MENVSNQDSLTKLNTELNRSMVFMKDVVDTPPQLSKHGKSIKINTTTQPRRVTKRSLTPKSQRSILKKSDRSFNENLIEDNVTNDERTSDAHDIKVTDKLLSSMEPQSRPHTLEEFVEKEVVDTELVLSKVFDLDDISDNEEVYMIDVPRSIDPRELHGKKISLSEKSKMKIKDKRYHTIAHNIGSNITCILNIGKKTPQYKTVNIKSIGSVIMRQKLPSTMKMEPIFSHSDMPLISDNIKTRHPLYGILYESKLRRSKKHSLLKKRIKT